MPEKSKSTTAPAGSCNDEAADFTGWRIILNATGADHVPTGQGNACIGISVAERLKPRVGSRRCWKIQ